MASPLFAVGIILLTIAIIIYSHQNIKQKNSGLYPQVDKETFLYYNPDQPSPSLISANQLALNLGVKLATPGQLGYYSSISGTAGWYGITLTGDIYSAPGTIYSPTNYIMRAPCDNIPYGVWLYGPKPPVDTKYISPFNGSKWFQPLLKTP